MEEQIDFKELLQLFNKHNVEYVIIGAYALAFHGCPRYTGDLDILVKPDSNNAKNIIAAIKEFGFESLDISAAFQASAPTATDIGKSSLTADPSTSSGQVAFSFIALSPEF